MDLRSWSSVLFDMVIELVQVEIVRNTCEYFHLGLYPAINTKCNKKKSLA